MKDRNQYEHAYDVIIIGAGAVGCACARELSRYQLSIAVLEKNSDVAGETSGRNSAVVHAGFNNKPGSMMARFCVEGNEGFEDLCRDLDVPYRRTGKLVAAFSKEDERTLEHLLEQGRANGCRDMEILRGEALRRCLSEQGMTWLASPHRIRAALWSPHTAITNPFLYCVALAENARVNGTDFYLDTEVTGIRQEHADRNKRKSESSIDDRSYAPGMRFSVMARNNMQDGGQTVLRCRYLINAAGLAADRIANMAGIDSYQIYPCRGEYFILDKQEMNTDLDQQRARKAGSDAMDQEAEGAWMGSIRLSMPVYPAPRTGEGGLGVHLTPTMEGNIIIGPSAEYLNQDDPAARSDYASTRPVMNRLLEEAGCFLGLGHGFDSRLLRPIGNYSGIRPKLAPPGEGGYHDFLIREEKTVPGLINLIGIESPGLTASVPIARQVCRMIDGMERGTCAAADRPVDADVVTDRPVDADVVTDRPVDADMVTDRPVDADAVTDRFVDADAVTDRPMNKETGVVSHQRGLIPREAFRKTRRGILRFREQSPQRQAELIRKDPEYGEIICRCQHITKREIREAIENPLGARSISAIKYRAWATTGRCNGGYCLPRIVQLLQEEYGMKPEEIRFRNAGSGLFTGPVK